MKSTANKCLISSLVLCFALTSIVIPMAGCGKVQQTLKTVLAKAPTVKSMIKTGFDVVNLVDPQALDNNLRATVNAVIPEVISDVTLLTDSIGIYVNDIAALPPGVLSKAQGLYQTIDANMARFVAAFHVGSNGAKEAQLLLDTLDTFLSELASTLPAAAAATVAISAQSMIKTQSALAGKKVTIVSLKTFAKNFNKASAANFPQIQVQVP